MVKLFAWLKGLTIVHFAVQALKHLWPLILLFIFWPEIDGMMSRFAWWREYISAVSRYVVTASNALRQIPVFSKISDAIGSGWNTLKARISQMILSI